MRPIKPKLRRIKGGWAALGDGWAVFAPTREEAQWMFYERLAEHVEMMERTSVDEEKP